MSLKIALGMPTIDSVPSEAFGAHLIVAAELAKKGKLFVFTPNGVMPHDTARIEITRRAVEARCDLLVFVDDDTIVPNGGISRLVDLLLERKVAAVSGLYLRRGFPYTCVWSKKDGKGGYQQAEALDGVYEIDLSGLGCAVIDLKWVVEHLEKPYYKMTPAPDGTMVTDDVTFFEQVREKGGVVLGCADVKCVHVGERVLISVDNATALRRPLVVPLQDPYGTHQKALERAVRETTGPVVEFGGGQYSTPLLAEVCRREGRELVTVESDAEWAKALGGKFSHEILDERAFWRKYSGSRWGLAFVDSQVGDEWIKHRTEQVARLHGAADVIVVHDCNAAGFVDDPEWRRLVASFEWVAVTGDSPQTMVLSDVMNVERWFEDGDNLHVDEGGLEKSPQVDGKEVCVGDGAA